MIFVGLLFDKNREKELLSKSTPHYVFNQVNEFQWNIVNGIMENQEPNIRILNMLPVGPWPNRYKSLYLHNKDWKYENINCTEIGSFNIPFIKQYQRFLRLRKALKRSDDKKVIIYSTYEPFLRAIYKLDSSYEITLIVPDMPEYYDHTKTSWIFGKLRNWNNKKIYKYCNRVDKFVLLTKAMKEPLNIGNRKYTIVEGICNDKKTLIKSNDVNPVYFNIAYAGGLNQVYGILNLVEAFTHLENKIFRLHIFGVGDTVDIITNCAQKDSRIIYHGFKDKPYVDSFLNSCQLLVNTRMNDGDYVKYSFPSKTLEYLLTGVPFLGYKLTGIPDEYDNYLNYIKDTSVAAIQEAITDVYMNYDNYLKRAGDAKEFVSNFKNRKYQGAKIIELLDMPR